MRSTSYHWLPLEAAIDRATSKTSDRRTDGTTGSETEGDSETDRQTEGKRKRDVTKEAARGMKRDRVVREWNEGEDCVKEATLRSTHSLRERREERKSESQRTRGIRSSVSRSMNRMGDMSA